MKPRSITKMFLAIMTTAGSVAQDDAVTAAAPVDTISPGSFGLSVPQSDHGFAANDEKLVISTIDKAFHSTHNLEMNDIHVGVINILNADEGTDNAFIPMKDEAIDIFMDADDLMVDVHPSAAKGRVVKFQTAFSTGY